MREWGIEAWKWIAAGALMGILTVMMVLGLGARRGTPLYRLRLSLWMIVLGLGGVSGTTAGCSEKGFVSCYDPDGGQVEEEDAADPDPGVDAEAVWPEVSCYYPDPYPEPVEDASTDPDTEQVDEEDLEDPDLDESDDA